MEEKMKDVFKKILDFILSFIQPKKNRASVYFQGSPVAVEVGGPYWRGNIEIGYGAQGVVQYGVRHIFKGKEKSENNIVELSN